MAQKATQEERERFVKEKKQKIEELQEEVKREDVPEYSSDFNKDLENAAVILAEVGLDELSKLESVMEQQEEVVKEKEKSVYELQKQELERIKEESVDQLYHREGLMLSQIRKGEIKSLIETAHSHQLINGAFAVTGLKLQEYLASAQLQVKRKYKDLTMDYLQTRHNLSEQKEKNATKNWRTTPQIIEVYVGVLRCVKDKLPKGRYAVLCSIIDRLGGKTVEIMRSRSKQWRRVTAPKAHSGEYHLDNLIFDESIMMQVPSRSELKPSMAILMELFLLRSKTYAHDQVLGWGVFPLIDSELELNKGRYKVDPSCANPCCRFHFCSARLIRISRSTKTSKILTETTWIRGWRTCTS